MRLPVFGRVSPGKSEFSLVFLVYGGVYEEIIIIIMASHGITSFILAYIIALYIFFLDCVHIYI